MEAQFHSIWLKDLSCGINQTSTKMKIRLFLPMVLLCIFSLSANATEKGTTQIATANTERSGNSSTIATALINRLHEIHAMTKKDLSSSERSALKKEVNGIKKELKQMDGGIYISTGVLLLIIILILIL